MPNFKFQIPNAFNWLTKVFKATEKHSITPSEYLRQQQSCHLPKYDPQDTRVKVLRKRLPSEVDELFVSGRVAMGEVGLHEPNALTRSLQSGRYVIEFYTGLMRLIYIVSRALGAATTVYLPQPQTPIQPYLSPREFSVIIGKVFLLLKETKHLIAPKHLIHKEQLDIAEAFANEAEFFVMMHELSHVWFAYKSPEGSETILKNYGKSQVEEHTADFLALTWSLNFVLSLEPHVSNRPSPRMVYAGAELTIRIYLFLERIGFEFGKSHPDAKVRLETLRVHAQMWCEKNKVPYDGLRTIAIANDEYLEATEKILLGIATTTPLQSLDRVRSKLLVMCEEYAKKMVNEDFITDEMLVLSEVVASDVLVTALRDVYHILKNRDALTAQVLERIVAKLPEKIRQPLLHEIKSN